ncbi:MAG: Ig-like domain-containing protein [Spirochaetota bacterium]|nr:Ig-like domain-containing protein [Spirochaetota bacterium]
MNRKVFGLILILFIGVFSFILIKCDQNDIAFVTLKTYKFVTVTSITPAISEVNVSKNSYISVNFSEAMNTSSFGNAISLQSNLGFVSVNTN